jgi:hypothetical protein
MGTLIWDFGPPTISFPRLRLPSAERLDDPPLRPEHPEQPDEGAGGEEPREPGDQPG